MMKTRIRFEARPSRITAMFCIFDLRLNRECDLKKRESKAMSNDDRTERGEAQIRFGQIKRDGYFLFNGNLWKRTRGRFACRVEAVGMGGWEWPFNLNTEVLPAN